MAINIHIKTVFSLTTAYIDNLDEVPHIQSLKRAIKPYDLTILLVDCTVGRFMDLHCYWMN